MWEDRARDLLYEQKTPGVFQTRSFRLKGEGIFLTHCYPSFPVDAGHRAVIFDRFRGVQDIVVGEGTHFLIPWVQKPIIFDCRSRPRNVPVNTGSKDLQNAITTICILFWPVASQLPHIFPSIGED